MYVNPVFIKISLISVTLFYLENNKLEQRFLLILSEVSQIIFQNYYQPIEIVLLNKEFIIEGLTM